MNKMTGIVIVIGSILFLIAAFMPITTVFVIKRDVAIVQSRLVEWVASLILFGSGGVITVVGMGLLTLHLRGIHQGAGASSLGFAAMAVGVVCWSVIVYLRYSLPLEIVFKEPVFGGWFVAYTLLTQIALVGYGVALSQAGFPRWLGFSTIGLAAASVIAYLVFKDMPPLAHYVITLVIGVALLF